MVRIPLTLALLTALALPAASSAAAPAKLDVRLQALSRVSVRQSSAARQAAAVSLPATGPGSIERTNGRVVFEATYSSPPATKLDALRAAGAQIIHVSPHYRAVDAAAPASALPAIAAIAGTSYVAPAITPRTNTWNQLTCRGDQTSAGDAVMHADTARDDFDVDGSGIKVGVLSDSYGTSGNAETPARDIQAGDLPGPGNLCGYLTPVNVLHDEFTGEDEGRAMLKIIHDVAPGAALLFSTDLPTQTAFADHVAGLDAAGADVIVDDVGFFDEPFFQEGPASVAVTNAVNDGVAYFSSAGNGARTDAGGHELGSWESPAYRAATCPTVTPAITATSCEDFDPTGATQTEQSITVGANRRGLIALSWSQPLHGVSTDFDTYLVDAGGNVVASGTSHNTTSGNPVEFFATPVSGASPVTYSLVIARNQANGGNALSPRLKWIDELGGVTEQDFNVSSGGDVVGQTIYGHNGAQDAVSVAARAAGGTAPEPYTSRGPVHLYWEPDNGSTPSAADDVTVNKPDLTAPDCTADTFFSNIAFCGTSAAAPHAAAVAALAFAAAPSATVAQVVTAMKSTAHPIGTATADIVGSGLVDADAAMATLATKTPVPTQATPFFTRTGASIGAGDPTQIGRFRRSSLPGVCGGTANPAPTLANANAVRYDSYPFTNLTDQTQCVRVDLQPGPSCLDDPNSILSSAYSPALTPADPLQHLLGTVATSPNGPGFSYMFRVAPGAPFSVVVNEVGPGGCASYGLSLDSDHPFASAPPTLSALNPTTHVITAAHGTWNGSPVYSYAWLRCDTAGGACTTIPGADGASYATTPADGGHRVRARVTASEFGISSSVASAASGVLPDRTAPDTTITAGPSGTTGNPAARFTFTSTEGGSHFRCALDGGAEVACVSPTTFRHLRFGRHTVGVVAIDAAGNRDGTSATRTFTVARPQTRVKSGPKRTTTSRTATFRLASSQSRSGFRCRLDGGKVRKCNGKATFRRLRRGRHTLRVYAVNRFGVKDTTPATYRWRVR